jgi:hypothetical protein
VRAEIEEVLGKEGLESLPQENAIHEETLIDEAEQHPASGPTIGQHSSQEDTEMENVEISQETTANTPRSGISRTISVPSSRHEHEKRLNSQGESPPVNLQSTTLPARIPQGGEMYGLLQLP